MPGWVHLDPYLHTIPYLDPYLHTIPYLDPYLHTTLSCLPDGQMRQFTPPGFYTGWLLPAALVGLAVFLYGCSIFTNMFLSSVPGMATLDQNVIAQEVCTEAAKK